MLLAIDTSAGTSVAVVDRDAGRPGPAVVAGHPQSRRAHRHVHRRVPGRGGRPAALRGRGRDGTWAVHRPAGRDRGGAGVRVRDRSSGGADRIARCDRVRSRPRGHHRDGCAPPRARGERVRGAGRRRHPGPARRPRPHPPRRRSRRRPRRCSRSRLPRSGCSPSACSCWAGRSARSSRSTCARPTSRSPAARSGSRHDHVAASARDGGRPRSDHGHRDARCSPMMPGAARTCSPS